MDLSFVKRFSVSATSREEWLDGTHPALEGTLAFFTDGSKQNGNTGSGSWEPNTGTALIGSAGPTATVFQSEILAIKICVEDLKRRRMFGQNISICSELLMMPAEYEDRDDIGEDAEWRTTANGDGMDGYSAGGEPRTAGGKKRTKRETAEPRTSDARSEDEMLVTGYVEA